MWVSVPQAIICAVALGNGTKMNAFISNSLSVKGKVRILSLSMGTHDLRFLRNFLANLRGFFYINIIINDDIIS